MDIILNDPNFPLPSLIDFRFSYALVAFSSLPFLFSFHSSGLSLSSLSSLSQSPRHTLGSFLLHISAPSGSLKRTGSAQNLAPPQQGSESGLSRSLPPSPQHTPRPSRKVGIAHFRFGLWVSVDFFWIFCRF